MLARRVVLTFLLAPSLLAAQVQVRPNGNRIDVIATATPLQEVLTRLSQQTGMKVVYDGSPPRTLVTVSLTQRTPAEAVLALFEGLGLNYALAMDRTGTRVEMLILSAPSAGGASAVRGSSGSAPLTPPTPDPRRGPTRPQPPVDEEREEEQADEDGAKPQAPPTPQGPVIFQGPIPGPGRPGSPFGGQVGPLTLPTPPPQNVPTPVPTPTPSASLDLDLD